MKINKGHFLIGKSNSKIYIILKRHINYSNKGIYITLIEYDKNKETYRIGLDNTNLYPYSWISIAYEKR